MTLTEVEKSAQNQGKGSKISDRLAAIQADSKKWEKKYEKSENVKSSGNGLADRLASIESNSKKWESKYDKSDRLGDDNKGLSQRLNLLNKSQETWKAKNAKVTDHQSLNVSYRAERYASPARVGKTRSLNITPSPEQRRGRVKEKVPSPTKISIPIGVPKIIVSPDDEMDRPPVSLVEKIATKKGEDNIKVKVTKERNLPTIDLDGLEEIFSSTAGCRHSIALGELDAISVDLPRQGQFLNTRPRKPRRNNSGRTSRKKNPLKSAIKGETTYTEVRTNVGEVMSGKFFANSALAGLAAKEDITNVRLRSASRNREDEQLPFRHPLLIRFKGRRRVFPSMVPCSHRSLCHDDSFILVTPDDVFTLLPELSNVVEKAKAKDFANFICQTSDLGTSAKRPRNVVQNGTEKFWELLGGQMDELTELDYDPDDEDDEYEHSQADTNRCWKLSNETPPALVPEMRGWAKLPTQQLLVTTGVFVFEFSNEVYLWLGSQVPFPTRRSAQQLARHLWRKYPRSDEAIFGRITQHRETALFTEKFDDWMRPNQENLLTPIHHRQKNVNDQGVNYKLISADLTKENSKLPIMSGKYNISDGSGEVVDRDGRIMKISTVEYEIKTINNGNLKNVENHTTLLESEVVIVIWKYSISGTGKWVGKEMRKVKQFSEPKGATRELVFLWGGAQSNELEVGEAALLATDLKLGTIFNVQRGSEPDAFTKAWDGNLRFESNSPGPKLFITMGNSLEGSYLEEIPPSSRNLRDTHGFLLLDNELKKFATYSTDRCQDVYKEALEKLTSQLLADGFTGGPSTERRHKRWFSSIVTGTIIESSPEEIEKVWRIEKCLDQLIPVQLPSRRLDQINLFDQANLQNVCIIRTSEKVLIWYENKETEGSNQSDYQNVINGAKTIAGRMFKEGETDLEVIPTGSEKIEFEQLFPTWKRPIIKV